MKYNSFCFCCNNSNLLEILDLGNQPLANSYLNSPDEYEEFFPLKLNYCSECTHLQLSHSINPDKLFKNYLYVSGTSNTANFYFKNFVNFTKKYCSGKKVLDIACNDGTQLNYFKDQGYDTYGIDPAENLYQISKKDHNIICSYFNHESMNKFNQKFDIIIAQNVLAHNSYPKEFLEICQQYLCDKGRIFIQTSQANMIKNGEFDTIYHEHLSYFTVKSFCTLARSVKLKVIDVQRTSIHGTSFIFVLSNDKDDIDQSEKFIKDEEEIQPINLKILNDYKESVLTFSNKLNTILNSFNKEKYKIIGYGAAAKGNTILNFTGIKLDYIIDDNKLKQGLYTPGNRTIIVDPNMINDENKSIIVLPLAWNFFDEIKEKILNKNKNIIFIKYFPKIEIL